MQQGCDVKPSENKMSLKKLLNDEETVKEEDEEMTEAAVALESYRKRKPPPCLKLEQQKKPRIVQKVPPASTSPISPSTTSASQNTPESACEKPRANQQKIDHEKQRRKEFSKKVDKLREMLPDNQLSPKSRVQILSATAQYLTQLNDKVQQLKKIMVDLERDNERSEKILFEKQSEQIATV